MMEKEYKKAKEAYEDFNLNGEYGLIENILEYIGKRIEENKKEIEEILKINNKKITYEEILKIVKEEIEKKEEYKTQINIKKREDRFVSGKYKTSVGIVAVESYETKESIKYMIKGIKTKNSIIISDVEYKETDEKGLIILIIKEALKKYGIKEELIERLPYEEVDYKKCDKVICTYDKKNEKDKEKSKKIYMYIEDEELEKYAEEEYEYQKNKGKEIEKLKGKIDEVIEKINEKESYGAVIYTKNAKIAYKYINLVRARNVFVNASVEYMEEAEEEKEKLLMNKKIMYELPKM